MNFANSLGDTRDGNEFSTSNTRAVADTLSRDFAELTRYGVDAFENANSGNNNVSTQLVSFCFHNNLKQFK